MADTLFAQVMDPSNRADPYPIYARLRETPVARQDNGLYVVSTYDEIRSLLFDPRLSSQVLPRRTHAKTGNPIKDWIINPIKDRIIEKHRSLVFRDPPDHDALRRLVMLQFTPERLQRMRGRVNTIVNDLIGKMQGRESIDLVEDFSYPLPVTVICEILGAPAQDEQRFHGWATTLATALDPEQHQSEAALRQTILDYDAISAYLGALVKAKRRCPGDDILSGLATHRDKKAGRLKGYDLIATAVLLLVAGHETTVNLITNGMLTLLRHPEHLARLRQEPSLAPRLIDELLRFEPPVQFIRRKPLSDIDIAGVRIPKSATVVLLLASGDRDPKRFPDPDRFDPSRENIQHFGFGAGIHYCVGAALARIEAEAALVALVNRLINPRLVADPPPYRPGASLRGPRHLEIKIDGVA